jgi:two-component system KDP operon response regulator KdpE
MTTVLVVEDEPGLREIVAEVLQSAGFDVVSAALAEEALDRMASLHPDVLVLDLGMPAGHMSGAELLARLRESRAWAALPVVVMTGLGDVVNRDVLAGLRVSATVDKPFAAERLIAAIEQAVRGV